MRNRPTYYEAVNWIADNDESSLRTVEDRRVVSEMISVVLVADLWGRNPLNVADDVLRERMRQDSED